MENKAGMVIIVLACVAVLFIGLAKKKMEMLLNITLRGILGTIAMFVVNTSLSSAGIALGIGINAVTILVCAILGFPGFMALYGLGIYRLVIG